MEVSGRQSAARARAIWVVGVTTTVLVWLVLTPWLFPATTRSTILTFPFLIPVIASACIWQNRLRRDFLEGYLPKQWSRASLFRVLGEKPTVGQKIMFFQISLIAYFFSTLAYRFPVVLSPLTLFVRNVDQITIASIFLSVAFAGMVAALVGDAVAVYLLTGSVHDETL